jgi:hypothetical protein
MTQTEINPTVSPNLAFYLFTLAFLRNSWVSANAAAAAAVTPPPTLLAFSNL